MVEVIGDVVEPIELIVPRTTTLPSLAGEIILSGDVLFYRTGAGAVAEVATA